MLNRKVKVLILYLTAPAAFLLTLTSPALAADSACLKTIMAFESALVQLAANRIDTVLGGVADSTRALGDGVARMAATPDMQIAHDATYWLARSTTLRRATGFQTWPNHLTAPPAFQAAYPGLYSFNGKTLSQQAMQQLNMFDRLAPTFRTAYESFPFSWVYMTTADKVMLIYPYLPIDQAVNDNDPTETVYYQAANFKQRDVGWTQPYLDLVGAGMMITVSYPVYVGDTLLGVMSRDITLKQLSAAVLSQLTTVKDSRALIIDGEGLAIDASDPKLALEIDQVNSKTGAAALYYRTPEGMATVDAKHAVASKHATVNMMAEQALTQATSGSNPTRLDFDDKRVLAARIERTSWLVLLILPQKAE